MTPERLAALREEEFRARAADPCMFATKIDFPKWNVLDSVLALVAVPPLLVYTFLWLYLTIASLPGMCALDFYRRLQDVPARRVEGWGFYVLTRLTFFLALPAGPVVLLWVVALWVYFLAVTAPIGLARCVLQQRWRTIAHNFALLWKYTKWVPWDWENMNRAVLGMLHRQSTCEMLIGAPLTGGIASFAFATLVKMVITNPFCLTLDEVYVNQWTPPLTDMSKEKAIDMLRDLVGTGLHGPEDRTAINHGAFSAHYPFQASDRPADTPVIGTQWSEKSKLMLLTKSRHSPPLAAVRPHAFTLNVECVVFYVELSTLLPWHVLVADVTVNYCTDKRIEHPMLAVVAPDSALSMKSYNSINELFRKYGPGDATEYLEHRHEHAKVESALARTLHVSGLILITSCTFGALFAALFLHSIGYFSPG